MPSMLDKTRKQLFPLSETEKKQSVFCSTIEKIGFFREMMHRAENPSSLCTQNISFLVKAEGASIKTSWKKVAQCRKNDGLKKHSDIACWSTEKTKFKTKNHFEKSYNAENCKRGTLWALFKIKY